MSDKTYAPSADFTANAHVDAAKYDEMYAASIKDPEAFWGEQGKRIDWIKPYSKVKDVDYTYGQVSIKWFEDGTLNVAANCIDRHLADRADQTAIIWEPDDPNDAAQHITYRQLHAETCRMANVLKNLGVGRGDRVVLYLPMIPEAAYAMLACARIGAIHSIVFAGFSPDALGARVNGCDAKLVITADTAPAADASPSSRTTSTRRSCTTPPTSSASWSSAPAIPLPGAATLTSGCTKRPKRSRTLASPRK